MIIIIVGIRNQSNDQSDSSRDFVRSKEDARLRQIRSYLSIKISLFTLEHTSQEFQHVLYAEVNQPDRYS